MYDGNGVTQTCGTNVYEFFYVFSDIIKYDIMCKIIKLGLLCWISMILLNVWLIYRLQMPHKVIIPSSGTGANSTDGWLCYAF